MRVLVCGSRKIGPGVISIVTRRLNELPMTATIIHGGAQGVDRIAAAWALVRARGATLYPADWETYGKRAGVIRNIEMLESRPVPDLVLAFWDGSSRGTMHTIAEAQARGIKTEVIPITPTPPESPR